MENPALLSQQAYESEAYKIHVRLATLRRSFLIFQNNYQELKDMMSKVVLPEVYLELTSINRRDDWDTVLLDIVRRFHNFVASAMMLVDHTRNIIPKAYAGNDFLKKYEDKKEEFFIKKPLHRFIQDLRVYTLHYDLPPIIGSLISQRNSEGGELKML